MVESDGGNGAAEFWLCDFAVAGNFETGAAVPDRPPVVAPGGSRETESRQEKFLQYFDSAARGDEGAARNQESARARDRDDRKSFGRRAVQSTGESDVERSGRRGGLAGNRRFRDADVARRKSARHKITARAGEALSPDRSERRRGRGLQSNHRDRSARRGGIAVGERRVGSRIDEQRRLDPGRKLSRIN